MTIESMKRLTVWFTFLLLAFSSFGDPVYTADFETNVGVWDSSTSSGTVSVVTGGTPGGDVYEGSQAFSILGATDYQERWFLKTGYTFAATGSVQYVMTAWVKTEGLNTAEAYISMDWLNASKSRVGLVTSSPLKVDTDWIKITLIGTAHADTGFIRPVLYLKNSVSGVDATAKVTFDNIEVSVYEPEVMDDALLFDGFEIGDSTNPDGWLSTTFEGTAEYITDGLAGLDVYEGSHAISVIGATNKQERWYIGTGDVPAADEDREYTMSIWVKTEGLDTAEAYISMDWLNASKSRIGLVKSAAITTNQGWTQVTVTGVSKVGTAYIRPVLYLQNTEEGVDADARVTFDNLKILLPPPEVGEITIEVVGSDAVVSWQGVSGQTYALQRKQDLGDVAWSNVVDGVSGVVGTLSATNATDELRAFYQVIIE